MMASLSVAQHPTCRTAGGGFNDTSMSLSRRPLTSSDGAVCNDGSAAQMYVRPCCDGADPGDFCNHTERSPVWLVVFGDGNADGWCWDGPSCARRMHDPSRSSSRTLPRYFARGGGRDDFRVGVFSKSGEGNPNFYPSYVAFIPHCSSDLFLGNSTSANGPPFFRGRSIAFAAIDALGGPMRASADAGALHVVIAGGAGVMLLLDELRARLPTGAQLSAVCDGCVLYDDNTAAAAAAAAASLAVASGAADGVGDRGGEGVGGSGACTSEDAFSCPPSHTLPQALNLWGASSPSSLGSCRGGWRCLLDSPSVVKGRPAPPRLLAQQPLYDAATRRAHAEASAASVRARLSQAIEAADVSVGAACGSAPSASLTHSTFFSITFGRGLPPPSYASALSSLVSGQRLALIDACAGIDCNANCPSNATHPAQAR